jgi:hypothetical protein
MISFKTVKLNTAFSICDNLDPDSNLTEESLTHPQKQPPPKTSTDAGRMISTKPDLQKAPQSIRDNFDPDSNVTEERYLHSEKQDSAKTSIDEGRMI